MRISLFLLALLTFGQLASLGAADDPFDAKKLPRVKSTGKIDVVGTFEGAMPTGVTVSKGGRIFLTFPRWGDPVEATVAELGKDGKLTPFPNADINRLDQKNPATSLLTVQSAVVDSLDRLWLCDTGTVNMGPVQAGGAKLLCIDLTTNEIVKTIPLGEPGVLKTTYLNDIRFDLRRGEEGIAFITDSSASGPNGIVVVDLKSGRSWRKLNDHPSTRADKNFMPIVEGRLMVDRPGSKDSPKPIRIGIDGIALSNDGKKLYYCPLASRHLYTVSTDALADPELPDEKVAATVEDLGDRGFASDGLEFDDKGRLYLTNYEHCAIMRRTADGRYETLVYDNRVMWPDTLSIAHDGFLYFTANQLHRQPRFHGGKDQRVKPYVLFKMKIESGPVMLKNQ